MPLGLGEVVAATCRVRPDAHHAAAPRVAKALISRRPPGFGGVGVAVPTPPPRAGSLPGGPRDRRQIGHHRGCLLVRPRLGNRRDPLLQLVDIEPAFAGVAG